jgi:hypothetical protein
MFPAHSQFNQSRLVNGLIENWPLGDLVRRHKWPVINAISEKWFCVAAGLGRLTTAPKLCQMCPSAILLRAGKKSHLTPSEWRANNPSVARIRILAQAAYFNAYAGLGATPRGYAPMTAAHPITRKSK